MATKPTTPSPSNTGTDVPVNAILTWTDGGSSDSYNVYFGTVQADVASGEVTVFRGNVTEVQYDPRVILTNSETYYWRVDAIEGGETATGDVWSFTVAASTANIDGKKYKKRMCALADNKFWYEDISSQPSDMVELSGLTLDTTVDIDMVEAFQKVLIVNGAGKYVVDFKNTKVTGSFTGDARPTFGMILEDVEADNDASMVVDYFDGSGTIYGFNLSADTFNSGDELVGINDDGDTVTFTLSANGVPPTVPHYYNWTTFGNDGSKGELPDLATIMCRYRGRVVLAGDSNYPHQWYMARQSNPFDMLYMEDDAQSAITGANSDFGQIGDIVVSLIPFSDDYLMFGCVNSMWLLAGDPASGGSLDLFADTTGIASKTAWCKDGGGNLYFVGNDGIYKIGRGFSSFENLSINKMPSIIDDLALDSGKQQITMGYDAKQHGLEICVTNLEDNSNANYWYDLRTNGFFPEMYQSDHAVYSQFYYQADEKEYKRLMVGCNDGYIRTFDPLSKNDDGSAIDSYAVMGPTPLASDDFREGLVNGLVMVSGGGDLGGSELDTDGLNCKLYASQTSEGVIEAIRAGTTPKYSYTHTGAGRGRHKKPRVRGVAMAVKLSNDNIDETWAIEKVPYEVKPVGRVR